MKYTGQPAPVDAWMADPDRPPFEPVTQYSIPQAAQPKAVRDAEKNFRRLVGEFNDCRSQIAEAKELRQHEIGRAHEASATARVEKTKPPAKKPDAVAAEWDERITGLKAELSVLADAVDQSGDTMIEAIAENRTEWLRALDQLDKDATARLAEALDAVEAALADLLPARSAPAWLEDWSPGSTQYVGGEGSGSGYLHELSKFVTPEKRLVGYRDQKPIWEEVVVGRPKKLRPIGSGTRIA
jgi:hypothetical protein